jgi:putative transposase
VFARGNDRRAIYVDAADRHTYLALLGRVVSKQEWRCLSYCLMTNHVHLLLETPKANLASGMQRLHSPYAQTFNARHGRSGHLFQGRYGDTRITSDGQLWITAVYIARNPSDAGLCERPEQWPWSSHTAVLGRQPPPWLDVARLLTYFAAAGGDPRRRYAQLVADRATTDDAPRHR